MSLAGKSAPDCLKDIMWRATMELQDYIKVAGKPKPSGGGWRRSKALFFDATTAGADGTGITIGLEPGLADFSPAWFSQGHEVRTNTFSNSNL